MKIFNTNGSRILVLLILFTIAVIGLKYTSIYAIILVASLVGIWILGVARVFMANISSHTTDDGKIVDEPFVSVHVPICSEPAEIVIATLQSILNQNYSNFEIIVLDNNTSDDRLWKPVERFCKSYENIRFQHFTKMEGYKAGALNWCRQNSNTDAKYIFTVDADYRLKEDCLKEAIIHTIGKSYALVQFPQSYYNVSTDNKGMEGEYAHFFRVYARGSNPRKAVLGTGTLSLINTAALDAIGGWPTGSITEDAELGFNFQNAGYSSVFIDKNLGSGLMPTDISSYRKQRIRWIFGNIQTLRGYLFSKPHSRNSFRESFMQLTAWINLGALPIIILGIFTLLPILNIIPFTAFQVALSFAGIFSILILKLVLFWLIYRKTNFSVARCYFTHLAFFYESAFSWWGALMGQKKPFARTSKFLASSQWYKFPMGLIAYFLVLSLLFLIQGYTIFMLISLFLALIYFTSTLVLKLELNSESDELCFNTNR